MPAHYYIILPDGIGHGQSSKPSDGLHARFPHYEYDDMVRAQYLLLTEGLKVESPAAADGYVDGLHALVDMAGRRIPISWTRPCRWHACPSKSPDAIGCSGR